MKRLICALFVATFAFSSCAVLDRTPSIYYNEDELSLYDITQMIESINEPLEAVSPLRLIPYGEETVENAVYWTEKGSVWHSSSSCSYLGKDSDIFYGSVENATECGKTRLCLPCEKKN